MKNFGQYVEFKTKKRLGEIKSINLEFSLDCFNVLGIGNNLKVKCYTFKSFLAD